MKVRYTLMSLLIVVAIGLVSFNGSCSALSEKVSTVKIGEDTLYRVVDLFGEPLGYYGANGYSDPISKDKANKSLAVGLDYGFMYVGFYNGKVKWFDVINVPDFAISGINIGTSLEQLYRSFGNPESIVEDKGTAVPYELGRVLITKDRQPKAYRDPIRKLVFWLDQSKVEKIRVYTL